MSLQNAQNYLVPAMGTTRIYAIRETLTAGVPIEVDFRSIGLDGRPYAPYGVMVDNSQGTAPLSITINDIGYTMNCAAGASMQQPYPAPLNQSATITGEGLVVVVFADYPVMPVNSTTNFSINQFDALIEPLELIAEKQDTMQDAFDAFATSALALLTQIRDNTTPTP